MFRVGIGSALLCWFRLLEGMDMRPCMRLAPGNLQILYSGWPCWMPCSEGVSDPSRDCLAPCPGIADVCAPEFMSGDCTSSRVPPIRMVVTGEPRDLRCPRIKLWHVSKIRSSIGEISHVKCPSTFFYPWGQLAG